MQTYCNYTSISGYDASAKARKYGKNGYTIEKWFQNVLLL